MNAYIVVYFLLQFNNFLFHGLNEKNKKRLYVVSAGFLILLAVLRSSGDDIWPDTPYYVDILNSLTSQLNWGEIITNSWGWEPGILYLAKTIRLFTVSDQILIASMSIVVLVPIFVMLYKYCYYPIIGLIVFYAMGLLVVSSLYRQFLAMAILSFSIKFIMERDLKKFLLCVILASFFHRITIVFIICYFLYDLRITTGKLLASVAISVGCGVFGNQIRDFLNHFARIPENYSPNGGMGFLIVLWICVLVTFIWCRGGFDDDKIRLPFNIVLVAAIIQPISFAFSNFSRIVYVFSLYLSVLLPNAIKYIEYGNESNHRMWFVIENIFIFILLGWFFVGGVHEYIPFWT